MNRISKKSTICAILCMLCCVIIFAGCGKSNENAKNQDSISYLHADFAIDMNNPNEVIGFSVYGNIKIPQRGNIKFPQWN